MLNTETTNNNNLLDAPKRNLSSEVKNMVEHLWSNFSPEEQIEVLNEVEAQLRHMHQEQITEVEKTLDVVSANLKKFNGNENPHSGRNNLLDTPVTEKGY